MKKRILAFTLVLLGLTILAAPKVLPMLRAKEAPATGGGRTGGGISTVRVRAIQVTPIDFAETVYATGTLRAEEGVELQTDTAGKIVGIHFDEGARVAAGDLLVKIYDADLQASLERAIARRNLAKTRAKRIEELFRFGGTNQQDYDAALSEVEVQEAEIRLIEAQISKTEIRAPFDGIVGLRTVSAGAYVAPATRIATLQKLENIKVDFAVPEKYAQRVSIGASIQFTVDGDSFVFSGRVYAAEPKIDVSTRSLLLRAVCENADQRLRPGSFAQIEFTLATTDEAILVPAEAVIPGLTEKTVFVLDDGRATLRSVRTGTRTEKSVQILGGLEPGETVIVSGLQQIRHGTPVLAVN